MYIKKTIRNKIDSKPKNPYSQTKPAKFNYAESRTSLSFQLKSAFRVTTVSVPAH